MNQDVTDGDISADMTTYEITERDKKLNDDYTVKIDVPSSACVINQTDEDMPSQRNSRPNNVTNSDARYTFPTILKMVVGSVRRNLMSLNMDEEEGESTNDIPSHIPTMDSIIEKAKLRHGIDLDEKQTKAFEMICTTYMIRLINDQHALFGGEPDQQQMTKMNAILEGLRSMGGKDQLVMFLTGPAGAGKTTAIKLAQTFCEKFAEASSISFDQYSFYFTAYTGTAASEFGGITTLTALQVPMYGDIREATEATISVLNRVKILIIDEISFMSVKHLQLISKRLQELFDCTKPFGGLSIIFSGDFRQLQVGQGSDDQVLYTTHSNMYFENLLNAALILENKHRFREDPLYGQILSDMWADGLSQDQIKEINKRVVMDKRSLPMFNGDCHYACPTNRHRNIISANNFRRHVLATHR
jgi:hypothetical protein